MKHKHLASSPPTTPLGCGRICVSVLAAVVLGLCLVGPVTAGPLSDATALIRKGDYAAALQLLRPLADKGDVLAQFKLGQLYARGWGVKRDYAEAIRWVRKAADQGLAMAQHNLGLAYANGEGVPQDYSEAMRWYRLAADQGYPSAQHKLGIAYALGQGVPRDPINAYMWITLSRMGGFDAKTVTSNRNTLAREMTPEQIAAAQKLADEWKPGTVGRLPLETEIAGHEAWEHFGEFADPSVWPISAVGTVTVAVFNRIERCTGTLVAPKLVLTAAHCLFVGKQLVNPGNVRFLAGLNKGVPAAYSVGKRLVISKEFLPDDNNKPAAAATDWAVIVLSEALSTRPISVKAIPHEQFASVSNSGSVQQIGYGKDRRYLPSIVPDCRVNESAYDGAFIFRCLTNFGYSGAPILAAIDGTTSVIGIGSRGSKEEQRGLAVSATQFDKTVAELMQSE